MAFTRSVGGATSSIRGLGRCSHYVDSVRCRSSFWYGLLPPKRRPHLRGRAGVLRRESPELDNLADRSEVPWKSTRSHLLMHRTESGLCGEPRFIRCASCRTRVAKESSTLRSHFFVTEQSDSEVVNVSVLNLVESPGR